MYVVWRECTRGIYISSGRESPVQHLSHRKYEFPVCWFYLVSCLNGYLYLIGVWFSEDQRTNMIKTHVQKRFDYVFKFYYSIGRIGAFS